MPATPSLQCGCALKDSIAQHPLHWDWGILQPNFFCSVPSVVEYFRNCAARSP